MPNMTTSNGSSAIDTVTISLLVTDNPKTINNFIEYRITNSFVIPTAEWMFTMPQFTPADIAYYGGTALDVFAPGTTIQIKINGQIQMTGYIEKVSERLDPHSGSVITIQGRDIMARVLEGHIDPLALYTTNSTLQSIVETTLAPFGITQIDNSDLLNINVMTGKTGLPDEDTTFTSKQLKSIKGKYGEGAFRFIERLLAHQGFMIWARADGNGVVISAPNYENSPLYSITHKASGNSNILSGERVIDITGQPTIIVAKGASTGDGSTSVISSFVVMLNELTAFDNNSNFLPQVAPIINKYITAGATIIPPRTQLFAYRQNININPIILPPMYIENKEAQDNNQLQLYVRHTMAHFQYKMYQLHYRVLGHTQNTVPYAVNTIISVSDDVLELNEDMWILERTFSKSPTGGTVTDLKLIRKYTLDIGTSLGGSKIQGLSNNSPVKT
jgi:prophage tail gpP-like protein